MQVPHSPREPHTAREMPMLSLDDTKAVTLTAGDLTAVFLPDHGMLGASLRHRGVEILRRIDDLGDAAAHGSTAGIPFLYPWANRLSQMHYKKAGPEVTLERTSPVLHFDANGLPIHGVPWSHLAWTIVDRNAHSVTATLEWSRPELLEVFPYAHHLSMTAYLRPDGLLIGTTIAAEEAGPVPLSFGFHPYIGLPEIPRSQWRLILPAMRKLGLDAQGIPTGKETEFSGFDASLGDQSFDDGFALLKEDPQAMFTISGGGLAATLAFLEGYTHAQVYSPEGADFIAIEPMTAPTNALVSGAGLRLLVPGGTFSAAFGIGIAPTA